jgi:hypothetical protein
MRTITLIVIHCSAVRPDQTSSAAQIDACHRRDNHWKDCPGIKDVVREYADLQPKEK